MDARIAEPSEIVGVMENGFTDFEPRMLNHLKESLGENEARDTVGAVRHEMFVTLGAISLARGFSDLFTVAEEARQLAWLAAAIGLRRVWKLAIRLDTRRARMTRRPWSRSEIVYLAR